MAFLRADEIIFEVTIVSSKTDQLRQGQVVPIASSGNPTCPVAMLRKYVELELASDLRLFQGISSTKGNVMSDRRPKLYEDEGTGARKD